MKKETLMNYSYRGHRIEAYQSKRGPIVLEVRGPNYSLTHDTHTLNYIERVVEASIDKAITKAGRNV
jgi:hypothetical protein